MENPHKKILLYFIMSKQTKNELIDFYKFVEKPSTKVDTNFNKHYILPNSHILCIGGTGSGKSTALMNFIAKSEKFCRIIIYAPTTDPLYELLLQKIPEVEMFTNIDEFPPLSEIEFNKDEPTETLVVFDDFITLKPKEMRKIKEYLVAGRKKGCSCFLMSQNYTSVPKDISRNCNYFFIFKINDNVSINNIIKNHNLDEIPKEIIKQAYHYCIREPRNFFIIDLKNSDDKFRYRKNFTELLNLK